MLPISIVANDYITIEYLPDKHLIYHLIHRPVSGQIFRDSLTAGTNALKQYSVCKWLSDDRKNGVIPKEDFEWGQQWSVDTIDANWKYWANVVPLEIAAAGSLIPAIEDLHGLGLRMMVFTDPEDALNWLYSLPNA
jgi:hypothetical protein